MANPNATGRPPHEATDENKKIVEALSAHGVRQEDICEYLGICTNTFSKYYNDIFRKSKIRQLALVSQTLYNKAIHGKDSSAVTAAIFIMKTQGRWQETVNHNVTSRTDPEFEKMTNEQLKRYIATGTIEQSDGSEGRDEAASQTVSS